MGAEYWDSDGKMRMRVSSPMLIEQQTESDAVSGKLTFATPISTISIQNTDATNDGVFTVNGIDLHVPSDKTFMSRVGGTPSAEVTVTGATTYIVSAYE